ncbi:MAG: hypothetical protein SXQ77_00705, partial [Halobacteria archaeon]|nr:hypothetical protein [Halobacteria archaeon]
MERRDFLKVFGGGVLSFGSWKAVDNVYLGYGKNLKNQELGKIAARNLPFPEYTTSLNGYVISVNSTWTDVYRRGSSDGEPLERLYHFSPDRAEEVDERLGFDGVLKELATDVPD